MKTAVLELTHITKQFGSVKAIDDVSFRVEKGEVVGFVGANGAGKTTTISTILGFINPTSGEIKVHDTRVLPRTMHKTHTRIGYAAGDMELPARLTGRQYLSFVAAQFGAKESRLNELCKKFAPELNKKIDTLSRGNRQKIALIAAFLPNPDFIVLDEPTSGLDPIMQEVFLNLVREEQAKGTTVFMSSHYLNEVADVCSRIILMRQGKIVEDIQAERLLAESGKNVRIVTGYTNTRAPKGAEGIMEEKNGNGQLVLSFTWKLAPAELQRWLAGVKLLHDIEVTEYNLEAVFKEMYLPEEEPHDA